MTVQVNLLPQELAQRERSRQITALAVGLVILWVALLGGLYALKLGELGDAETARDDVQAEVARLEAEVAQLQQYRELADELEARNVLLAEAMATEISYARVLNDLSLSFPASSSMRTLDANTVDPDSAAPGATIGAAVATLTFDGYSVERYAPGVETVLVEFGKVPVFFNPYLSTAGTEAIGNTDVIGFNGFVQLGPEAFTRRYENGLPEGERP
jgi:hypothetical protein